MFPLGDKVAENERSYTLILRTISAENFAIIVREMVIR